jgi:hypothetical protein
MPVTFQDREQGFEAKFAHDEELRFLAVARRDKLFAQWAANKMRLAEDANDALMRDVLAIPDGSAHDKAVLRHIEEVLSARGAVVSEAGLGAALADCMRQALRQLAGTTPSILEGP